MIIQKQFNGIEVEFEPLMKNKNVMVNATQMAKVFGKYTKDFMILGTTQNFILECLKTENSRFLGIETEEDLIFSKQKSGTWMHRVLALKFAAWLNPAFELWVYRIIDEILFGALLETEDSIEKTVSLQIEINSLMRKEKKTGEDFDRFLELKKEQSKERSRRKTLTTERFGQIYDLFNQPKSIQSN